MEPWLEFLKAFAGVFDTHLAKVIREAWSPSREKRTIFYANVFLPVVANALQLDRRQEEYLNIDHVFRGRDSEGVPRMFIETENVVIGADREIRKLCAVLCPLKVLITVANGVWPPLGGNPQNALLGRWREIARAHHRVCPDPGVLGVLVSECCAQDDFDRFRFYAYHFDTAIGEWQADGIYQRSLAGSDQTGQRLDGWPR
jgi:hypothetical protein